MGPEINIDSILALERQTKEGTGDVIHLKRFRNSLLNISTRIPPEILGTSFVGASSLKKNLAGYGGVLTTSSSSVTTGSKSPPAPLNFGIFGATL